MFNWFWGGIGSTYTRSDNINLVKEADVVQIVCFCWFITAQVKENKIGN